MLARLLAPVVLTIALVAVTIPANNATAEFRDCRASLAECLIPDFSDFYAHRLAVRLVDLAVDAKISQFDLARALTVLPINMRRITSFSDWYFSALSAQWSRNADLQMMPYR